jgi:predicted MFS family arabinose efflux permease
MSLPDAAIRGAKPAPPPGLPGEPQARAIVAQNTSLIFIAYLAAGLEAAVVPSYVDHRLGLSATLAGVAVSTQPLATLVSRSFSGSVTNRFGPRLAVFRGLLLIVLAGICFCAGAATGPDHRLPDYCLLLMSRFILGVGISWVSAAGGAWAIGRAGDGNTSRIFVWSGIAAYASLAIGAPGGLWIVAHWNAQTLGLLIAAVAFGGAVFAWRLPDAVKAGAPPLRLLAVLSRVAPYGSVLFLAASGYGIFLAFVTLFFQNGGWAGASWPLACCGLGSVAVRLLLGRWIDRYGVFRVGLISVGVELCGLMLLALSTGPAEALTAAFLIGAGFSLIFPALCVPTVLSVGPADRASAISVYTGFLELATSLAGPLAGLVIARAGFRPAFWAGFALAGAGGAVLAAILRRQSPVPDSPSAAPKFSS